MYSVITRRERVTGTKFQGGQVGDFIAQIGKLGDIFDHC